MLKLLLWSTTASRPPVTTLNKSPWTSFGRGWLAGAATAIGGPIGGGAATAALTGGDPGKGALLGTVQVGFAAIGALIPAPPFPGNVLTNAALAAGQSASGAAIVGGDVGEAAWRSAAAAAAQTVAMAIANGDFQRAIDGGQQAGPEGVAAAGAYAAREASSPFPYALRPISPSMGGALSFVSPGPSTTPQVSPLSPGIRKALTIIALIWKLFTGEDDDPNKPPPPKRDDHYGRMVDRDPDAELERFKQIYGGPR